MLRIEFHGCNEAIIEGSPIIQTAIHQKVSQRRFPVGFEIGIVKFLVDGIHENDKGLHALHQLAHPTYSGASCRRSY